MNLMHLIKRIGLIYLDLKNKLNSKRFLYRLIKRFRD